MARRGISQETTQLVRQRAQERCEYCRCPENVSPDTFAIEHIHPRTLGGSNAANNLALSCQGCNGPKAAKIEALDLVTGATVPLFHPRRQLWSEHFRWSDDALRVEGISSIGRVTIETLHLNRLGVVNLRRLLVRDERHPPDE